MREEYASQRIYMAQETSQRIVVELRVHIPWPITASIFGLHMHTEAGAIELIEFIPIRFESFGLNPGDSLLTLLWWAA